MWRRWRRRCGMWWSATRACARSFPERDGVARQEILEASAVRPRLVVSAVSEAGLAGALAAAAGAGFDLSASRRCGRICLQLSERSTYCFWFCTTLPGTGGRWDRCLGILRIAMRRGGAGRRPGWRRCRCNMPTTRCGSMKCWGRRAMAGSAIARQLGFWRGAAGWASRSDRAAERPCAACGGEPSRRGGGVEAVRGAARCAAGACAGMWGEPVHGAAGWAWRGC